MKKAVLVNRHTGEEFDYDYYTVKTASNLKFIKVYYRAAVDLPNLAKCELILVSFLMTHIKSNDPLITLSYEIVKAWCVKRKFKLSRSSYYRAVDGLKASGWLIDTERGTEVNRKMLFVGRGE